MKRGCYNLTWFRLGPHVAIIDSKYLLSYQVEISAIVEAQNSTLEKVRLSSPGAYIQIKDDYGYRPDLTN